MKKKNTKASGSPTTVRVAGKRPKDFYAMDRKRLAVEMAKAEGDDPTASRSAYVRVVRGELLAEAVERARQTLVVIDEYCHEINSAHLDELGQAARLWTEIGQKCAERQRQLALMEAEASATSQAMMQKLVVNGMFDANGHFYLGGVAHVEGVPFCADIWGIILSYLKHDDRVRFSRASRAFCRLSRSRITKITIGKYGYCTRADFEANRKALAESGRDALLDEVLALPHCREVVIESCAHRDSPVPWWVADQIIANSFAKHMPGIGNVRLVFRGHNSANCDTFSNVFSALVMANRRAVVMPRLECITVDSIAALTEFMEKSALAKLRYPILSNTVIPIVLDLGDRSDLSDVSCNDYFHVDETVRRESLVRFSFAPVPHGGYEVSAPAIFVKTAADWDRAIFLSYSGLDIQRLILSTTVYIDPFDTHDVSRCGEPHCHGAPSELRG